MQVVHRIGFGSLATGGVVEPLRCDVSCIAHLEPHKALGTPLQLYSNVVISQQPFKLPIISVIGHLATGPGDCGAIKIKVSC